ncbi:MAG: hypothetical protein NZ108_06760, partial [Bacteroidia bacterium]|nr:hypothetical protein [Bacteroidia bacterium]
MKQRLSFILTHTYEWLWIIVPIFAIKLTWLWLEGPAYETDSPGYLLAVRSYYHPPLYGLFLFVLKLVGKNLYFFAIAQTLIFSVLAAWCIQQWYKQFSTKLITAFLIGIDPLSSFFCRDMMAECLFIAGLLGWLGCCMKFQQNLKVTWLKWIGVSMAFVYLTRLIGIVLPIIWTITVLLVPNLRIHWLKNSMIPLLVMQLTLLPVRITYWYSFGSPALQAFGGL